MYEYVLEVIVQVNLKSQNYIDKPGIQNQLYFLNMTYFSVRMIKVVKQPTELI